MTVDEAVELALKKEFDANVNQMSSDGSWNICMTEKSLVSFANACEKIGIEKIAKYFESLGDRECDSCAKAIRNYLTHTA